MQGLILISDGMRSSRGYLSIDFDSMMEHLSASLGLSKAWKSLRTLSFGLTAGEKHVSLSHDHCYFYIT